MHPSYASLPCISHRSCLYHTHSYIIRSRLSNVPIKIRASMNIAPGEERRVQESHKSTLNERPRADLKKAPIQRLPTELLLSILAYLGPVEKGSLALTCHSLASAIGSDVWRPVGKLSDADLRLRDRFLDLLQRDLDEEWWRCRDCECFHPRLKFPPEKPNSALELASKLANALQLRVGHGKKDLRLGTHDNLLYILDFELVKAVMDRHFLGSPHGVCLNSLKCRNVRTFSMSNTQELVLKYNFTSKIVLDRLLLHASYSFTLKSTMYVQNAHRLADIDWSTIEQALDKIQFNICSHQDTTNLPANKIGGVHSCPFCPTQFTVTNPPYQDKSLSIQVYHNLGSGRSAKDAKWAHIVKCRKGMGIGKYKWGQEDIVGAFDRILCSTREEFERQVQRSDGMGNWYEPELGRRGYKTLPVMIAKRL